MEESHKSMTICPRHRAEFGIRWRCSKVRCSVPTEIAAHKTETVKGDRRLDGMQSEYILRATGKLVPVGSRKLNVVSFCNKHLLEGSRRLRIHRMEGKVTLTADYYSYFSNM